MKNIFKLNRWPALRLSKGFTLIEILVVIGIIAILATIVIIAINPARQFAQTRNTQRVSHVNSILNAIGQRIADNKGIFEGTLNGVICPTLSTTTPVLVSTLDTCLVPTYISVALNDPKISLTDYNVVASSTSGRITVSAPSVELGQTISVTR